MGNSSINGPFSMAMLNNQRVLVTTRFYNMWMILDDQNP